MEMEKQKEKQAPGTYFTLFSATEWFASVFAPTDSGPLR